MTHPLPTEDDLTEVAEVASAIRASIGSVLSGLDGAITATLATALAGGHLLMEDVPGVGKTTLARAFAASVDCTLGRIQFTPDLMPADVTGVSIFRSDDHRFEFRPGPIFAQVVIADEINRASPKTQSALLEAMQEHAVTVDGVTRRLPEPFLVVATQNPIDMEGTYPLPEAQRDRFMAQVSVGYPQPHDEMAMLDSHDGTDPLAEVRPVTDTATLARLIDVARRIYAAPAVKQHIVDLVSQTRNDSALRLGASPRASLQLLAASKARAAMAGRNHVLPDDVKALAGAVLSHRLVVSTEARLGGRSAHDVVTQIVERTPVPTEARASRMAPVGAVRSEAR
ncbi:MoxR family ATPase [Demequina sp. NBRC 110051]|uniref:AAA family ATPase n=1 Tax=Demequina sp. NBRC 110051 TaxID=1570340 RepID=UPI0009FEFAF6|nr:MoxR family ATPase [Demequina sp. NBRC 110051]